MTYEPTRTYMFHKTPRSLFKDIDGLPTPWQADARPYWKRLLRKIYVRYVGDAYLPRPKSVELVRERQAIHPRYGQVTHIVLHGKGYEPNGTFIIGQFGTEIIEHTT